VRTGASRKAYRSTGKQEYVTDPKTNPYSDSDLMRRHRGDELALGMLIQRYKDELFAFLARFTGDSHLAEDVFQDTFLQVHLKADGFDLSKRFKPWLYTIAANKARDAMRKRSRRPTVPLDASMGTDDDAKSFASTLEGNIPGPDEISANLETRHAVRTMINELPEAQREVLTLAYFNGMPYQDVADTIGAPLGTVKSRLHAAIREFAKRWTHYARET
jgi:RNA polymerase sigma-70 factor (ECF subfamily)